MMKEFHFESDCDMSLPHLHDGLEILYVMSGKIGVMQIGKNYALRAGEFIVLNPFEHHEQYRDAGAHTVSLFVSYPFLKGLGMPEVRCCSADRLEYSEYYELIRGKLAVIYREYLQSGELREMYCLSKLLEILDILKQQFSSAEEARVGHNEKLSQVLKYLNQHYMDDITLQSVAENCYLSAGYLSRQFEKVMGMHFSEYLRMIRLSAVEILLRTTDRSVTDIGLSCGFGNPNTLINNFKKQYGIIPSKYRDFIEAHAKQTADLNRTVYDMGLLRYAAQEAEGSILNKSHLPLLNVDVDLNRAGRTYSNICNVALSCGYAKQMLRDGFLGVLQKIGNQIHPAFLQVQGVFDDSIHTYSLDADGKPRYDFYLVDQVMERICSVGAKPWIELGRMPRDLAAQQQYEFFDGYTEIPYDFAKWKDLVFAFLTHLKERFGAEEVNQWRFSVMPALYTSYGVFSIDEYMPFYQCTVEIIRRELPKAVISGATFDCGLLKVANQKDLVQFLEIAKDQHCLPDLLSVQEFTVDYGKTDLDSIVKRMREQKDIEPAPPSDDPDLLAKDIAMMQKAMQEAEVEPIPITFLYWNSTIWEGDLGNDTCYNSAFLVKHYIENLEKVDSLCATVAYNAQQGEELFAGSSALFTNEIPKAMFHAYCLLNKMEERLIETGDGYAVARSEDGTRYTILLHHYCPPDPSVHLSQLVPREEQLTIDRYYGFRSPGVLGYRFDLYGAKDSDWCMETYRISREAGSAYDCWRKIGAPGRLDEAHKKYLEDISQPGYTIEIMSSIENHMVISGTLDEHEVRLICLKKSES